MKKTLFLTAICVIILATTCLSAFALPPADDNIVSAYEPKYMNIVGEQYGNESAEYVHSNTVLDLVAKTSLGLSYVMYDTSAYSDRVVNTVQPFYYYFDYSQPRTNLGTNNRPRLYVWVGSGVIEKADGSTVGNSSSMIGFSITDVNHESFTITSLSGGNVQYDDVSTFATSSWVSYNANSPYWENASVYSFRIAVNKESAQIELQALTDSYWETLKTVNILESETFTLNSLAFGTYDRVDGYATDNDTYYGTTRISYIRYQDYNKVYEEISRASFDTGYAEGKRNGIEEGKSVGFDEGYREGKKDGEVSEIAIPEVISTIMNSTVTLFRNIFGFELFGINISALIGSIALICVLAWLIRKLVK